MSSAPLAPMAVSGAMDDVWVAVAAPRPVVRTALRQHASREAGHTSELLRATDVPTAAVADSDARDYISRLWAEDWNSPEDAVYDA